MAAALVGGAFLSATLQVLFDRMASQQVVDFIRGKSLESKLKDQLEIKLLTAGAVLDDAEEKQFKNESVNKWLAELKHAVYKAEDLVDEIATEALRHRIEAETPTAKDKVFRFLAFIDPITKQMERNLDDILQKLDLLLEQMIHLDLHKDSGKRTYNSKSRSSTSTVTESGVYGRLEEKEYVMKLLSEAESEKQIDLITIVGMGGLGKTTLAQLIYNDPRLKEYDFVLQAWVCVSQEFDALRIAKAALKGFTNRTCGTDEDLNQVQGKLKELLLGKKFLLVLDDIWNDNYDDWDRLKTLFIFGAKGSKIILTTRHESVASIMKTVPTLYLKELSDDNCWKLFAKHAFDYVSVRSDLEPIGRGIVKKCKGLPLAAKMLGGLLRSKQDVKEWKEVLNNNIWDLCDDADKVLPALSLSYHYLPSHLKRCFAYCSLFPEDHEFEKKELIPLWMAEGLLDEYSNRKKTLYETGDAYFKDLVSKSFFQQSTGDKTCFVMHDLISDLARFMGKDTFVRLRDEESSDEVTEKTKHVSNLIGRYDLFKKFHTLNKAKCLRTFFTLKCSTSQSVYSYVSNKLVHDLLPNARNLRVLSLSGYTNITELFEEIGNLKHLRYLDLRYTLIKRLPTSLCVLYNLQTLLLFGCNGLVELPKGIGRLVNLQHLDIRFTRLRMLPEGVDNLKGLRVLTDFAVGEGGKSNIRMLKELQHLSGSLCISNIQNVVSLKDTEDANLVGKENLKQIQLRWRCQTENSEHDRNVLERLKPYVCLEHLEIEGYGGTSFPKWVGHHSFNKMVTLRLSDCENCFTLPPLGRLRLLKELHIDGFSAVEKVGGEFHGNDSVATKPFQSLEVLRLDDMPEWQEWNSEEVRFYRLRELYVKDCPKLSKALPKHLPCLEMLEIRNCGNLVGGLPRAPGLSELTLANCDKLEVNEWPLGLRRMRVHGSQSLIDSLVELMMQNNTGLESLSISKRSSSPEGRSLLQVSALPATLKNLEIRGVFALELPTIPVFTLLESVSFDCPTISVDSLQLGLFPGLKSAEICNFGNINSFSALESSHQDLTSLNFIQIWNCASLECFPAGLRAPNLTSFSLASCKRLKGLPEDMHSLLPSLQHLSIKYCEEMDSFPQGGLPSKLKFLSIERCEKLVSGRMQWGLQTLSSLTELSIDSADCIESFPDKQLLPSSLIFLCLSSLPNIKVLDDEGLRHLTSLQSLSIIHCPKLQGLPGLHTLTSLKRMKIYSCPDLQSISPAQLPLSLSLVGIRNCPLLREHYDKHKIQDWHISVLQIDDQYVVQ